MGQKLKPIVESISA